MAELQLIGRIVLMDGERIERKAQSSLVRKPLSESARSPLMIMAMVMMIIISSMTMIVIIIISIYNLYDNEDCRYMQIAPFGISHRWNWVLFIIIIITINALSSSSSLPFS